MLGFSIFFIGFALGGAFVVFIDIVCEDNEK